MVTKEAMAVLLEKQRRHEGENRRADYISVSGAKLPKDKWTPFGIPMPKKPAPNITKTR